MNLTPPTTMVAAAAAAAAAAKPRCLSDLPDELLQRILFFAPAREGATTAVLSRRWRWLWRTCGAVNLDTRSFKRQEDEPGIQPQEQWRTPPYGSRFSTKEREVFLRAAGEALAAAGAAPITRLSVVVAANNRINTTHLEDWSEHDLIGAVLNNPAARRVEELHVEVGDVFNEKFSLSFDGSLPSSKTLRVAHINGALLTAVPPPDAVAFPQLAELHLERCTVPLVVLQRIVDAAPQLETLHLESCYMPKEEEKEEEQEEEEEEEEEYHYNGLLVLPSVTALMFASCDYQSWNEAGIEIDAPRLQYFRYQGSVWDSDGLSLRRQKPAANLVQVDLDFIDAHRSCNARFQKHELFWRFIRNFSTAKVLKIQLHFTMDRIALVADKGSQDELLGGLLFSLLGRLELQAQYDPARGSTTVMLANLLHCCPVVRDLRLKLSKGYFGKHSSIFKEVQADFNKSVDCFRNRISPIMVSMGGEDDGGNHEAPYIPGLSDESFYCLRSYLRRVSLHFCMDDLNCLGVQLAKFFAENAMVLEEMYVDDGSKKMQEHMNNTSVGRSLANYSAKGRNFGGIVILPR